MNWATLKEEALLFIGFYLLGAGGSGVFCYDLIGYRYYLARLLFYGGLALLAIRFYQAVKTDFFE